MAPPGANLWPHLPETDLSDDARGSLKTKGLISGQAISIPIRIR